jgi:hypothetical protein
MASLPAAAAGVAYAAGGGVVSIGAAVGGAAPRLGERGRGGAVATRLEPFDFQSVRLLPSHWQQQYESARAFYAGVSNDDILHGYRARAGLAARGAPLGGWARPTSGGIFGQWLSGMSRMYRATGDAAMRDKATYLFAEWAKALPADGDAGTSHYGWDKLVCGLVDLAGYAGHEDAVGALEKITNWARRSLSRENRPADPSHNRGYGGTPWEWYTLAENLYRAYRLTGNPTFREFAEVWHYTPYWDKFARTSMPDNAHGGHAYSHVNTFSSAAMAYEVSGDETYLRIIRNAYDYLQQTQCYATGGYGPNERFMAPDGSLGRALETRSDTTEIGCGSWAGFKLSRYLMCATGEARYGDWIERLVYNGLGAMLPLTGRGRNFYYADYRVGGGIKVYNWDTYTCCSGTYIQNVADYHNLIYFRDAAGPREAASPGSAAGRRQEADLGDAVRRSRDAGLGGAAGLYVNLFLPSEVRWDGPAGEVRLRQETLYPDADTTTLTLSLGAPATFPLHFRVPGWARDVAVRVNGAAVDVPAVAGEWARLERTWTDGDRVEIRMPLALRMKAVDRQHPDRVAVLRGPVVLALEGAYHDANFRLPERNDDLERWLVPQEWSAAIAYRMPIEETALPRPTVFRVVPPDGSAVRLRFRPFYDIGEGYPYFIYFDRDRLPWRLW